MVENHQHKPIQRHCDFSEYCFGVINADQIFSSLSKMYLKGFRI